MSLKYTTKSYINKIERQKAVSRFATKAGVSLKDARIYYREGLTPAEARKINKMVENQGLGPKFKSIDTLNQIFGKIKSKEIGKQSNKEVMARFLSTNKIAGTKKDAFKAFTSQAVWNPNWTSQNASMNNLKTMLQESGQFRKFSGIMLKHRGMKEDWDPTHITYDGHGSDNHGQFVQYTYTSMKNGVEYRKAIIKIYQSSDDVKTEYYDVMTGDEI